MKYGIIRLVREPQGSNETFPDSDVYVLSEIITQAIHYPQSYITRDRCRTTEVCLKTEQWSRCSTNYILWRLTINKLRLLRWAMFCPRKMHVFIKEQTWKRTLLYWELAFLSVGFIEAFEPLAKRFDGTRKIGWQIIGYILGESIIILASTYINITIRNSYCVYLLFLVYNYVENFHAKSSQG